MEAALILLALAAPTVMSDVHSLRVFETVATAAVSGFPDHYIVAYVDDTLLTKFTSVTRVFIPQVQWVVNREKEYFERETMRARHHLYTYRKRLENLMERSNRTEGFHVYQYMYGCELREDGSFDTYMQEGFDGRDFLYLDTKMGIYIPVMDEAQLITQLWNSPEINYGEVKRNVHEAMCMEYLKKCIGYGKNDLEKRVPPEVKVWGHQAEEGVTRLYCLVYGFFPRAVDVKWMRNQTDQMTSTEASPILPHPDGTYQTRVSVEVPTGDEGSYSCHVDHSSLEEPRVFIWEPPPKTSWKDLTIYIGIAVLASLAVSVLGIFIWKRWTQSRNSGGQNRGELPGPLQELQIPILTPPAIQKSEDLNA